MNMKRISWGLMMIAAVALLAGCGGGGGTSLMVGGQRATQDLINALQTTADNEKKRADDAEEQRDAARTILGVVASELGLEGDPTQMDYTNAIMALEEDSQDLAAVRLDLGLGDDATRAMIIAAIDALQARPMPSTLPAPTAMSNGILGAIVSPPQKGIPRRRRVSFIINDRGRGLLLLTKGFS